MTAPAGGGGPSIVFADPSMTIHLDIIKPEVLSEQSRRDLRLIQALLEVSLDNVREALAEQERRRIFGEPSR